MSEKRELKILPNIPPVLSSDTVDKETGASEDKIPTSLVTLSSSKAGKDAYWRSMEELAETPEFTEFLHREFPQNASEWTDPQGRRRFLKLMGASIALAGLSSAACTVQPEEKIIPYVKQPEELIPGKPLFYATAMPFGSTASALLVESHEGRPTKIEGNPEHSHNKGAAGVFEQASILTLYDPDRSQTVTRIGDVLSWSSFLTALRQVLEVQKIEQGTGLRILTGAICSPTLADQLTSIESLYPQMKVHQYEAIHNSNAMAGAKLIFGEAVEPLYQFDKAKIIFSLDADFLASHPANVKNIRDFVSRRRLQNGSKEMSRFYAVETCPTNTGAKADHRLAIRASDMEAFALAVAAKLGVEGATASGDVGHSEWIAALADDLQKNRGASLIIAGAEQPPFVHALAYAMNNALGNIGETVNFMTPLEENTVDHIESIKELVADINGGKVEALIILGGNPAYTAPADLNFIEAMQKVKFTAHLNLYNNETSGYSQWHIPEAHYLEAWSDVRFADGTMSIVQPLIAPLYQGKSAHEVLASFTENAGLSYELVRDYWLSRINAPQTAAASSATATTSPASAAAASTTSSTSESATSETTQATPAGDAEAAWRKAVHDGVIVGSAASPKTVTAKAGWVSAASQSTIRNPQSAIELVFRPDSNVYDGRFANNGWLQELPKPLSKITWGNVAHLSPATAREKGLQNGDIIELRYDGRAVNNVPVWIMPGHANNSVTVNLGYGRARCGRVGDAVGFNAYVLRTSAAQWVGVGVELVKTGSGAVVATTQDHWAMEGRHLVRDATLEHYLEKPDYARHLTEDPEAKGVSLFPEYEYNGHKWGMAIDLNNCVGCNACVVACQSEKNIPIVGKEEVAMGREMHWIRIDRYYKGHEGDAHQEDNPEFFFQPVPCMHCELAPCELVCPVAATVHSAEGLNDMVYNRCVGTRYCANNCPYKVRRFNFFLYQDFVTESMKLQRNPDVSVRSRGVMEKCTYCVQRIQEAKIEYRKDDEPIPDGAIQTACQQTCPADAIVFGDMNDPNSRVAKLKNEPRNFGLLQELNARPRTTFLAEIRNPHASLKKPDTGGHSGGSH